MSRVWLRQHTRVIVAQMAGDSDALDDGARKVLRSVIRAASGSVDTGNYISKLSIKKVRGEKGTGRTVMDRLVVADDDAAISIEYGHLVPLPEGVEGPRQWVPGKKYMTRGLAGVKTID